MNRTFAFITFVILFFSFSSLTAQVRPDCKQTHKVARKETIYGIARLYGITQAELLAANPQLEEKGLKKGATLCIPYGSAERDSMRRASDVQADREKKDREPGPETIRVALILPFSLNAPTPNEEAQKMVDFYEGLLLVADSLKRTGQNLDILVLDEGTAEASNIHTVLVHSALPQADLIIGPGRSANVNAVAAFAQQHQIPLVLPFANGADIVGGRPYVFQCNAPKASHYQKIINRFIARHRSDNILFVERDERHDADAYTAELQKTLKDKGIHFAQMNLSDLDEALPTWLNTSKNNLIIPLSASSGVFEMLCLKLNDLNVTPAHSVQLMGSPEWQTLPGKSQKNMHKYNATYFATFYTNSFSTRTQRFTQDFFRAFGRQQQPCYPRYGEMGHDVAAFFLTALQRYGKSFPSHVQSHDFNSLQLPLHFVRKDEQSGYVNTATYVIYYKDNGDVILTTF